MEYTKIETLCSFNKETTMANNNISVHTRKRKKAGGMSSLYLDVCYGSTAKIDPQTQEVKYIPNRDRKVTGLEIFDKPKNDKERKHNKEVEALAEEIRYRKECQLKATTIFGKEDLNTEKDFYEFFEEYIDDYEKKDIRQIKRALHQFKNYLAQKPRYRCYRNNLNCRSLSEDMIKGYAQYLRMKFKGEGAHTVFQRFKKVVKKAVKSGYIDRNPCEDIVIKCNTDYIAKETLTQDEIQLLIDTKMTGLNPIVERAFLFTLITGIRGCDLRTLTYENVNFTDKTLKFNQKKTDGNSSASWVTQPLSEFHLQLIGKPKDGDRKQLIFKLPSDTYCNRQLKDWVSAAGIEKHITWYSARHSFATNLCEKDVNLSTVMTLMGHSSLKYTNKYVHVRDKSKKAAMETICENFIKRSEEGKNEIPESQKCYVKIYPFIKDNEIKYLIKDLLTDTILTDCDGWGFNTEEEARKMIEPRKTWIERPLGLT